MNNQAGTSILEATNEQLEEVLQTNQLLPGIDLNGLQQRSDFLKLFKNRHNPKLIAQVLLRERLLQLTNGSVSGNSTKSFRELELEFKKAKLETQTQMNANIYRKLQDIEDTQVAILQMLTKLSQS